MRDVPEGLIPDEISKLYEIHNWRNAAQILASSYPAEFEDVLDILGKFRLRKSDIIVGGGAKSNISDGIDGAFFERGWKERQVSYKVTIDDSVRETNTHKIDCYRNRVGLDEEPEGAVEKIRCEHRERAARRSVPDCTRRRGTHELDHD